MIRAASRCPPRVSAPGSRSTSQIAGRNTSRAALAARGACVALSGRTTTRGCSCSPPWRSRFSISAAASAASPNRRARSHDSSRRLRGDSSRPSRGSRGHACQRDKSRAHLASGSRVLRASAAFAHGEDIGPDRDRATRRGRSAVAPTRHDSRQIARSATTPEMGGKTATETNRHGKRGLQLRGGLWHSHVAGWLRGSSLSCGQQTRSEP